MAQGQPDTGYSHSGKGASTEKMLPLGCPVGSISLTSDVCEWTQPTAGSTDLLYWATQTVLMRGWFDFVFPEAIWGHVVVTGIECCQLS